MNLPFYLLKSLTKMGKRVQSNPRTIDKSLFHQGLIKMIVLYAFIEVQVSWRQLLTFLGFDEQGSKIQKTTSDQKPRVSTKKDDTSKSTVKLQESSHVARQTRSNKIKLMVQQEEEVKQTHESSISKHDFMGYNRVCTRRIIGQKEEQLKEMKIEPETEIHDVPINNSPQVRQRKRSKGKQPVNYPNMPKTKATNKLRLKGFV
jgi:hypothetical protein